MKAKMKLTKYNYHSLEANREYMSHSQYLDFMECEAMAYAVHVTGEFEKERTEALHEGQLVHEYFGGDWERYAKENELFATTGKYKGELKARYKNFFKMVQALEGDELCMKFLNGQHEVIFTADYAGCTWRIMVDVLNDKFFTDIKKTKSITDKVWIQVKEYDEVFSQKVSFIEAYNYYMQFAIYSEILRRATKSKQWKEGFIVAVTTSELPNKEVISMYNETRIEDELLKIQEMMPRILSVKSGQDEPISCNKESCKYCMSTKKAKIIYAEDL